MAHDDVLAAFGLDDYLDDGHDLGVSTPIDGTTIGHLATTDEDSVDDLVARASTAFAEWRQIPAPRRGQLARLLGDALRRQKESLGRLVTLETGKILQEGLGEVQEMIDICDFAVGLSRQLHGLTIASERPGHALREAWHPLGVTAIITAFNFPVAVWSWNAALALVCGNPVMWKPSERTPLTALAVQRILSEAISDFGDEAPPDLSQVLIGGPGLGSALAAHPEVALVSATGSTAMGRVVSEAVAGRLGRTILELGGNNAAIVSNSANIDLAVDAVIFSAVGTAGQRCTTLRRLIVHDDVYDRVLDRLRPAYASLPIGDPFHERTLVGPMIDSAALAKMQRTLRAARADGGEVRGGARILTEEFPGAIYVEPALVEMPRQTAIVREETFAPVLFVMRYGELTEAIAMNNAVPQGLSSALFTSEVREAEVFVSALGSDCGLANINAGPSGAEIGGAFGGEKDTGGGRESGSDAWKNYMRRQTITVNYSDSLPLAQGISFAASG